MTAGQLGWLCLAGHCEIDPHYCPSGNARRSICFVTFEIWYLPLGVLLILMALFSASVERLPLTETLIYLGAAVLLGPYGFGLIFFDPQAHAVLLERLAELAVIVSLFTAGLKLRTPLRDDRWRIPLRLAFGSMTLTVGMVALVGVFLLGLPLGAAVLLGAILAPTDPVLASGVQLEDPSDRDRLRFSLTGEAGLNDGTAFPFVMLGLGLLGLHEIGDWGWRWWAVDVVWRIIGGLTIGAACGATVGRIMVHLRQKHQEGLGRDEFLTIGLIALSYGGAMAAHTYGFLAVFAAGLLLRRIEHRKSCDTAPGPKETTTPPQNIKTHMTQALLRFNERIERILEVVLVLLIGLALSPGYLRVEEIGFIVLLFLVVRPIAVMTGLLGNRTGAVERGMISWFGIRGIGSVYYLMYAVNHGLDPDLAWQLISLVLTVVAVSIVVHGITVTPLMTWYQRHHGSS